MVTVFLGIGSNLGDRRGNCDLARFLLRKKGLRVLGSSPLYETEAVTHIPGQASPPYLNGALRVETNLDPAGLLDLLEEVERLVGRRTKGDWAPRPIDLDILFYGDRVVHSERLKIPHPELVRRAFVLKPLLDIDPNFVHPVLRKPVREIYDAIVH